MTIYQPWLTKVRHLFCSFFYFAALKKNKTSLHTMREPIFEEEAEASTFIRFYTILTITL